MTSPEMGPSGSEEENIPHNEEKEAREAMLDILESAFERKLRVQLTVSEPSKTFRQNEVFIEGMEGGVLYVSDSKDSAVMGLPIDSVVDAKILFEKE